MAATVPFGEMLDRKTSSPRGPGSMPRIALSPLQAVWLYHLEAFELRCSATDGRAEPRRTTAKTEAPGEPSDSSTGPAAPRATHRVLSTRARRALGLLIELGATELDERFGPHQLKRAFRRLALSLHPDRHPDAGPSERRRLARAFADMTDAVHELLAVASH